MARMMLRRTKSSSLLPIVRLTNYFYPEDTTTSNSTTKDTTQLMEVYSTTHHHSRGDGARGTVTPPPDYEQLYQAMQFDTMVTEEGDRVRKKYACQGNPPYIPGVSVAVGSMVSFVCFPVRLFRGRSWGILADGFCRTEVGCFGFGGGGFEYAWE